MEGKHMVKLKPKEIKLRAFKVINKDLKKSSSDLMKLLKQRLNNSVVKDRMMVLNAEDEFKESDLIANFDVKKDSYIFGSIMRVTQKEEVPQLPDSFLNESRIDIEELKSLTETTSLIYKSHYYFMLNDDYVITTLPVSTTIKCMETYINSILDELRGDSLFGFNTMMKKQGQVKLGEIKDIRIKNSTVPVSAMKQKSTEQTYVQKMVDISFSTVKHFMSEKTNISEEDLQQIVSAELLIKFARPKGMKKEVYNEKLGAIMNPISDTDDIIFYTKSGPVTGSEIMWIEPIKVEMTENKRISEKDLKLQMEEFLLKLKNEKGN